MCLILNLIVFRSLALSTEYNIFNQPVLPLLPPPCLVERVNKNHETYMRIFHNEHQQLWYQTLNWLQNALNSAVHQSTKATPAKLLCDKDFLWCSTDNNVPDVAVEIDFDFLEDDDTPDYNMVEDVSWAQDIEDTMRSPLYKDMSSGSDNTHKDEPHPSTSERARLT